VGAGSAVVNAGFDQAAGAFQATGQPLNVAIAGTGYFQIRRTDGTIALTRDGDFTADANGEVVTQNGDHLVPPLQIPKGTDPSTISISADGVVSAGQTTIGKITLVDVPNENGLLALGGNLYAPTANSGGVQAVAGSQIQQGYLESSNVDLGTTMVALIDAQRSYQMDSRAIQNQDQMMQVANNIRQ
jgi:flagellar basal-body rod protein FlgG